MRKLFFQILRIDLNTNFLKIQSNIIDILKKVIGEEKQCKIYDIF